jgi:hypothetical protein
MTGAHDACRQVHVQPDVRRRIESGLASVDAYSNPDPRFLESGRRLLDRGERLDCRTEGVKEAVAGSVHLVACVARAGRPDDAPLLVKDSEIRVATELVQQPRRALHVGEDQRHRPRGLRDHLYMPIAW